MSIYVIDDHPLMCEAIAMLVRRLRPSEKIVELGRLDKLSSAVVHHGEPELVCLDLKLPDATGVSGVMTIRQRYPDVPIAVYSGSPAADMQAACIHAGATVYVEKSASAKEFTEVLRGLLVGEAEDGDAEPTHKNHNKLTKRQTQLMTMLDQGLSNKAIADELKISEHTVKVHMWRMFRRLNVKSRTQALHHARSHGLLSVGTL
jgi:DNA-binding NarL/FixJ family response regulator